jgi:hypothetical protein
MPIAAMGRQGSSRQEGVIGFLLFTLGMAMVAVCVIVLAGLQAG